MRILVAGDTGPSHTNFKMFSEGNCVELYGDGILRLFSEVDYRILNLEVPLTDNITPLGCCPPDLHAPAATINGIKCLNPTLVTLANNHILDQNTQGLYSTIDLLQKNGIEFIGAGKNLEEAAKPYIFSGGNKKIGVYACAEHEFSIAGDEIPGANPFDPLNSLDYISALKKQCDYVIVLHHGGLQGYQYPTPQLQKVCRKMCDKGADLVICQHSHCIGCEENYKCSKIIYGQGNFLLDQTDLESWKTGLLLCLKFDDNGFDVQYYPVVKNKNTVKLALKDESELIIRAFYERSKQIKEKGFVDRLFAEYCSLCENKYLLVIFGVSGLFKRIINRTTRGFFLKKWYGRKARMMVLDYIICESHQEVLQRIMRNK